MINLEEVMKFVPYQPGTGIVLDNDKRRVVRLELNTECPCQIKLQTGADHIRFLANVDGRDTVSFIASGPVTVWLDGGDGEVWWWCPEIEETHVVLPDAATFTKIATRKARNPELERIAAKMAENSSRMFAHLAGEMEGLRQQNQSLQQEAQRERARKPKKSNSAPASEAGGGDADPAGAQAEAEAQSGGSGDGE